MQHLFLVNVGPVQDFIAAARRSRDLWFSSWLLSELSRAAAQTVVAHNNNSLDRLIFPALGTQADLAAGATSSVANKILALIDGSPDALAEAVEKAMRDRLAAICNRAFDSLDSRSRQVAQQQTDDLLEYFWAALPLENERDYPIVRDRLEATMAARKATRDVGPVRWGATLPKSSLDGQRESVIPESQYPSTRAIQDEQQRAANRRKAAELYSRYNAGPAERLSGVDLLKRRGNRGDDAHFPSTSHMASLPLLARLALDPAKVAGPLTTYVRALHDLGINPDTAPPPYNGATAVIGGLDGSVLFEGRFFEDWPEELLDQVTVDRAREALGAFLNAAADGRRPLPYYALLLADGDGMGRAIDAQTFRSDHRDLSQALDRFASEVRSIVETEHGGGLVYAGGDDVLAFVPLHTVLPCARALGVRFAQHLADFTYADGGTQHTPTLSVGVAVSHHIEPLSDALALARKAEKRAKHVPRKNALAVTVSKRSGSDRTVAGPWGMLDERLAWLVGLHRADAVPDGAAYELEELALRLTVPSGDKLYASLQEATRKEAIRILRRKKAARGAEAIAREDRERLEDVINGGQVRVHDLAQELIIARLFADAEDVANLPLKAATERTVKPCPPGLSSRATH